MKGRRKAAGREGRGVIRWVNQMGERSSCPFLHIDAMIFLFLLDAINTNCMSSNISFNYGDVPFHCVTINVANSGNASGPVGASVRKAIYNAYPHVK